MPQGEHTACHHVAADVILSGIVKLANIEEFTIYDGRGLTGYSGGPDFRAVSHYVCHTKHHRHQSPIQKAFVTRQLLGNPKNHGFRQSTPTVKDKRKSISHVT